MTYSNDEEEDENTFLYLIDNNELSNYNKQVSLHWIVVGHIPSLSLRYRPLENNNDPIWLIQCCCYTANGGDYLILLQLSAIIINIVLFLL